MPMKKTRGPGAVSQLAQDLLPGGFYKEPELRVIERQVQLAKNKMAKLYNQEHEKPDKLVYDMKMFESLVAMKPLMKKLKDELVQDLSNTKTARKLGSKLVPDEVFHETDSKDKTADISENIPKDVNDDSMFGKAKEKLIKYGVLESREEIMEQRENNRIREKLKERYANLDESIVELTTVSTPESEKEDHFASQTERQLENVMLLEGEKKVDKESNVKSESSSDSAEEKVAQSDDSKRQYKEKISGKG